MKHRFFIILIIAALTCVSFSGCYNGSGENDNSVVVAIQQDLGTLDPHEVEAAGTEEILFNIFEGLVKCDVNGNFNPAIAESYVVSADYLKYTFKIRENIKFHNGEILDTGDVVYSIKRAIELGNSSSPLKNIEDVKVTEENTVEITLKEANTDLILFLDCAIIPEGYSEQNVKPIGTGPFKFKEYIPQERIVIEKNEDYYLEDKKAKLDRVTFKIVASVDAAFLELKSGSIDIFPYLTADKTDQIKNSYQILEGNQNLIQLMAFNNSSDVFKDVKVRQAVNYAVDKQKIIELTSYGYGVPLGSTMSPKSAAKYYNKETDSLYVTDTDKARALLKEAGYENGLEFTISVPSNYQFHVDTAQVIADQLQNVGITAKIELVDWATWLDRVYSGRNYEATIIGLTPGLAPSDAVSRYYSSASDNFLNYSNSEFDAVFDSTIKELDEESKIEGYKKLQQLISEDAAAVYIQDPSLLVAVKNNIAGYSFYPYYVQDMSTVYIKDADA